MDDLIQCLTSNQPGVCAEKFNKLTEKSLNVKNNKKNQNVTKKCQYLFDKYQIDVHDKSNDEVL